MMTVTKKYIPAFVATAILVFSSCSEKPKTPAVPPAAPPPQVDVIVASAENISNRIEVNGAVVANEYVELRPETAGRITFLEVPEGKYIAKGTVIARINDADLQAQLRKANNQLQLAQTTEERLKKLLDVKGVNQADYDVAVNDVNTQQSEINRLKALIDKTVVKAPFDGLVGLRRLSVGAYVTSADVITTIQQTTNLKVDFTLPENYSAYIKTGSSVDVAMNERDKHFTATVIASEPTVNAGTRSIVIRALLHGDKSVTAGSFVKVYVNAGSDKNRIMVPTNAIIPDAMNKKLVLVKNNLAVYTDVETGLRNADKIEITKGIATGDTIIVAGILFARPGKPVVIKSVRQDTVVSKN